MSLRIPFFAKAEQRAERSLEKSASAEHLRRKFPVRAGGYDPLPAGAYSKERHQQQVAAIKTEMRGPSTSQP